MFITFKSQGNESPFGRTRAPGHVCGILNKAAGKPDVWEHVCEFSVPMKTSSSTEKKRGMLFYNTTMKDVRVDWIQDLIKSESLQEKV